MSDTGTVVETINAAVVLVMAKLEQLLDELKTIEKNTRKK